MIPAWLGIGLITVAVGVGINRLLPSDQRWFFRLRRPSWLTFEWAIPLIWTTIFICGGWSAYIVWQAQPPQVGWVMAGYLLLEVVTLCYTPVMCFFRRLRIGVAIGATGLVIALGLAVVVRSLDISAASSAAGLLVPYLLWSPIGTFVTWQMMGLNPVDA
jgi:translocator protein